MQTEKDSGRPGGLSSSGPSPKKVSAVPASIPDAEDFVRWGLLTRNPAPNAAGQITAGHMRIVITADGRVLPLNQCPHSGWSFARHGRLCPGCGATMLDFGD